MLINKLHNEDKVRFEKIAIHIPQIAEIRSYIKREFELYNIPFRMRAGKKLSEYPEGRLFDLIRNCALENFNFEVFLFPKKSAAGNWTPGFMEDLLLPALKQDTSECSYFYNTSH